MRSFVNFDVSFQWELSIHTNLNIDALKLFFHDVFLIDSRGNSSF